MNVLDADQLNRTVKIEIDTGRAATIDEAIAMASHYVLQLDTGPDIADSPTQQAMLLTAVNIAARAFLGGVRIRSVANPVLSTPWAAKQTLSEAVRTYGGQLVTELHDTHPTLVIGHPPQATDRPFLHLTWDGWTAAAIKESANRLSETTEFPLAGVLAAALGVSETFQYLRGSPRAGWRDVGLSLWSPQTTWHEAPTGPPHTYLPKRLFIAGLGHLGQAICWTLGCLPYPNTGDVELALQDFDTIIEANHSTGLLTQKGDRGQRKTRIVASRLEQLGFTTSIIERHVDTNTRRTANEPNWAIAGFDRLEPRRALANAGFDKVIDLALGASANDYLDILIHVFPSTLQPEKVWPGATPNTAHRPMAAAYNNLVKQKIAAGMPEGAARCGAVEIAGRSVAAAFVGTTAATMAIAELLRELLGGAAADIPSHEVLAISLANPTHAQAAPNQRTTPVTHPGFIPAAASLARQPRVNR